MSGYDVASREALKLLLIAARHQDSGWSIEGSSDWSKKPGRLTVWMDYSQEMFDRVYDSLNCDDEAIE